MTAFKGPRRSLNITASQVLIALGLAVSIAVVYSFTQKIKQTRSIRAEGGRLSTTATALMREQDALRVTQAYVESGDFPERDGPAVLKYLPPGAVLVVVVTSVAEGEIPASPPTPVVEQEVDDNLQTWRKLFFDPQD